MNSTLFQRPLAAGSPRSAEWSARGDSAERKVGTSREISNRRFHDDNRHVAVFGRAVILPAADYFRIIFLPGFLLTTEARQQLGLACRVSREAGRRRRTDGVFILLVRFGASDDANDLLLRDALRTSQRHSLGGNLGKGAGLGTGFKQVTSGSTALPVFPWIRYGESLFHMDPYLHLIFRPTSSKISLGRWKPSRLQQPLGAGLCFHQQSGWPRCFSAGISNISRRPQRQF